MMGSNLEHDDCSNVEFFSVANAKFRADGPGQGMTILHILAYEELM